MEFGREEGAGDTCRQLDKGIQGPGFGLEEGAGAHVGGRLGCADTRGRTEAFGAVGQGLGLGREAHVAVKGSPLASTVWNACIKGLLDRAGPVVQEGSSASAARQPRCFDSPTSLNTCSRCKWKLPSWKLPTSDARAQAASRGPH